MNLLSAIGNTPLVELNNLNGNSKIRIFGKLEGSNPGGSIKDRSAGWNVKMENMMIGKASPTPKGEIIKEGALDALPVSDTRLEWGVLTAH